MLFWEIKRQSENCLHLIVWGVYLFFRSITEVLKNMKKLLLLSVFFVTINFSSNAQLFSVNLDSIQVKGTDVVLHVGDTVKIDKPLDGKAYRFIREVAVIGDPSPLDPEIADNLFGVIKSISQTKKHHKEGSKDFTAYVTTYYTTRPDDLYSAYNIYYQAFKDKVVHLKKPKTKGKTKLDKLLQLKDMLDQGLITKKEFEEQKNALKKQ